MNTSCTACGHANPATNRFCGACGVPLARACAVCAHTNPTDHRFCGACGAALSTQPPSATAEAEARKIVTVVFADLVGSTALHERLDAESTRRVMDRYYGALRAAVTAHRGTVVKLLGDGVMAAFGVPRVAEDDAVRAVRAAVAIRQAVKGLGATGLGKESSTITPNPLTPSPLSVRIAVNTGEVVVSADNGDVVGDPVNVAARLQQEARAGDILVGEATRRLVSTLVTLEPVGNLALKGRSEAVAAYRVVSLERPAGTPALAFVGRDEEMHRIEGIYATTVAARTTRLAVILGSPGLGKSRLMHEVACRIGDRATILCAQCNQTGGATFAPLAEAFRSFLRLEAGAGDAVVRTAIARRLPDDAPEHTRIAAGMTALLTGDPPSPEETFFVVRRFLAALAAARPVVLQLDDLQWAEPLLLDLTEHLVQWSPEVPMLILAAARPELRDVRASLAVPGNLIADAITLAGLDAGAATRLAANAIGAGELPAAVAGRILAISEGNPLFVGELVRMLVQDGTLTREGNRWTTTVELAQLDMPPTIHALLASRIERLVPEERVVLERAAIIGRHFSRAALAHLLPPDFDQLDTQLESLRRGELIEPDGGWFLGEPALRFHHVLIRDAAYRRALKGTRAELHARFADWAEARVGQAAEHEETIGWHLEQAHQLLGELGPIDTRARSLGERAARYLAAAGRRALERDDVARAANLLGRALAPLDAEAPARAELALDWCEALLTAGVVAAAATAIDELGRLVGSGANDRSDPTDRSDRLRAWHACFAGQLAVLTDPATLHATAETVAAAADTLTALGDAAGEAKAHAVHATALARLGRIGACEEALDRALAAARRAGDRRRANTVLAGAPIAALWGPSPVTRASGRCLDVVRVLRITQGAPAVEAVALRCQAALEALRGRIEPARRMIASARQLVEELGITQHLLDAEVLAGLIELLDGNAVPAERHLRLAYDGLRQHGLGIDAAQAAALLGRALLAQHRAAEAEALSHESEALAGDDLKAAIAWRGVRAEALARRGEHAAALAFARDAVAIAATTDALLDHADARIALTAALRAAGRAAEADAEEQRAVELWEAKGATLLAERVRRAPGTPVAAHVHATTSAAAGTDRRVRPNLATANAARIDAALRDRDEAALAALFDEQLEVIDHPTGVTYGREGALMSLTRLLKAEGARIAHTILETLGDKLALCRQHAVVESSSDDTMPYGRIEREALVIVAVDEHGQRVGSEFFAHTRLSEAVTRLYERYATSLPPGAAADRAVATARSVAAVLGPFDLERYAAGIAADVEFIDHRRVGFPSGHGAGELLRGVGTLLETADAVETRVDDIVALRPDAFLVRWTTSGRDRLSRGPFEWQFLRLCVFGADGLLIRAEQFDPDCEDQALARFDEVGDGSEPPRRSSAFPKRRSTAEKWPRAGVVNAAARAQEQFERCWEGRDLEAILASYAPGFLMDDRRALVRLPLSGNDFSTSLRLMLELSGSRWQSELWATRGERLALSSGLFAGGDGTEDAVEFAHLALVEVDAADRFLAVVIFDPDNVDAAYAELDARYTAGEAAPFFHVCAAMRAFRAAFAARDWDALAAQLAPDLIVRDHRRLGWETLHGPDAYIHALQTIVDLAPDVQFRRDHVTACEHGYLVLVNWIGHRDGGPFEASSVIVVELDEACRGLGMDQYDVDHLAEARQRLTDVREPASGGPAVETVGSIPTPPNAASRLRGRLNDAFMAQDWPALRALALPDLVFEDRRPWTAVSGGIDMWMASIEYVRSAPSVRFTDELIAVFGDRIALHRRVVTGVDFDGGPFENEFLLLTEIDAAGRLAASINFDVRARADAIAEAQKRARANEVGPP